jgi:hypothetical protein
MQLKSHCGDAIEIALCLREMARVNDSIYSNFTKMRDGACS